MPAARRHRAEGASWGLPAAWLSCAMSVLKPLVSPAGFVLALLFFVLPFVAVSCEDSDLGSFEVSYTGLDLATGGDPSIEVVDRSGSVGNTDTEPPPEPGPPVFAIITAALAVAGLGTTVIRSPRVRTLAAGGTAVLAMAMLLTTETVVRANLESDIRDRVGRTEFRVDDLELVHTRIGFWLALASLAAVAGFNIVVAMRAWVRQVG
jgi:hypothetical protein